MMHKVVGPAMLLLLAACSRAEVPTADAERTAEDLVQAAQISGEAESLPDGTFAPRDECGSLAGVADFRSRLEEAVEARSADALVTLAADDVRLDFGGGAGVEELRRRLKSERSPLWEELDELMELGCGINSVGGVTLPWYFTQDLPTDSYTGMIVVGEDVPLHEAPSADAPVIGQLSWEAVEVIAGEGTEEGFRHVRYTPAELEGYMPEDRLRSIIDYRLIAASRNGRWRIVSLLAGD